MPTVVTLTGWKEFEAKAKNLPKVLMKEIDLEVTDAAEYWAGLSKRDAPKDVVFLAGQIDVKHISDGNSEVVSNAEYSAYMEWGTKSRVKVPGDLSSYASQFRGKGNGGDMKKMILSWCERKGISKEYWYPIFLSIIRKGVHPHPFFFIQVPLVQRQLFANVQKILNTEH